MDIEENAYTNSKTMLGYFRIIAAFLDEVARVTIWPSFMSSHSSMQNMTGADPSHLTNDRQANGTASNQLSTAEQGQLGSQQEQMRGSMGQASMGGIGEIPPNGINGHLENGIQYDAYDPALYHQGLFPQNSMRPTVGYSVPADTTGSEPPAINKRSSGESEQERASNFSLRGVPGYLQYGWTADTSHVGYSIPHCQLPVTSCTSSAYQTEQVPVRQDISDTNSLPPSSSHSGASESASHTGEATQTVTSAASESKPAQKSRVAGTPEFWAKLDKMRTVYRDKLVEIEPFLPIIAEGQRPYLKGKFLKHVEDVFGILDLLPQNSIPPSLTTDVLEKACRFIENVLEVYKKLVQKHTETGMNALVKQKKATEELKAKGEDGSEKTVLETQKISPSVTEAPQQSKSES
eukprot:IDg17573t1